MCVKLKKSTIIIIVTSWILFFVAAFLVYGKLGQMKQDRLTNEKIFQTTTKKDTSQNVIKEDNSVKKKQKKDPDADKKAVEEIGRAHV